MRNQRERERADRQTDRQRERRADRGRERPVYRHLASFLKVERDPKNLDNQRKRGGGKVTLQNPENDLMYPW